MMRRLLYLLLMLRDLKLFRFFIRKLPLNISKSLRKILHSLVSTQKLNPSEIVLNFHTDLNPLVSVIIPNYNHGEFLGDAIESVIKQSYENIELIIVDDGSTDNSRIVLDEYKVNPKVKIFYREHFGLTQALNYGFSFAKGSIFTWTSADNLIGKNGIETLVKSLGENKNTGMVYSDYSLINQEGHLASSSNFRAYDQDPDNKFIIRTFRPNKLNCYLPDNFIGPFFAYRREVALRVGEYKELNGFEDYDYWLRIDKICHITHVPTHGDLYFYRIHQKTLTAQAKQNQTYKRLIKHLKTNE